MKTPKFILNRTEDYLYHSKLWIIGYASLFYLCSIIIFSMLLTFCVFIYNCIGLDPETMTNFGGDPTYLKKSNDNLHFLLSVLVTAPLCEELIFRLGLSSKRKIFFRWVGLLPAIIVWYFIQKDFLLIFLLLGFGVLTAISLYRFTSSDMWEIFISKYFVRLIWINALLFGLLHLTAFTELSIELFPYALCLSVWPFLGGCVITYIRVNIGFFACVVAHIIFNLPGVLATMICL